MTGDKLHRDKYLVRLPKSIDLPNRETIFGYESIPKFGETIACNERKAVSNFIFRNKIFRDRREAGAKVLVRLDDYFGGVEDHAIIVQEPVLFYGKEDLTKEEKDTLRRGYLANELAKRHGSSDCPWEYINKAGDLLNKVSKHN